MAKAAELSLDDPIYAEARALRDKIYGHPITDNSWEQTKRYWAEDIRWLREKAKS